MSRELQLRLYVAAVIGLSVFSAAALWQVHHPFPGWWPFVLFVFVAVVLESSYTKLQTAARGSTSFIAHMATALLFGGWWAAVVAVISTVVGELGRRNQPLKVVFNVSQRILAIAVATTAYEWTGAQLPPTYLAHSVSFASSGVQRDLGLFFVLSAAYFLTNKLAVSCVVAISSGRPFREVWSINTRGVMFYDLIASAIGVLVAWLYVRFDQWLGFGSLGLIGVILPIVAVRHVYELYRQLEHSGQELLQVMVKAIEARDPYTSGHSLRVSAVSRAIAVELGLSAREIEEVETAALLHDVGKIYEEFAPVLRKEDRLTPEETALMQTHSTKSAELVGLISKFRGFIQDSVRHHHERWDGKGYPAGIAGKNIPLGARIILVADTIDAMTTDRPYRKRLGLEIVIAELQKCRGSQFDPDIIDVVISSVAVRQLIAGASAGEIPQVTELHPKRISWPAAALWKVRRVHG